MVFSITGDLLSGSAQNPDITTFIFIRKARFGSDTNVLAKPCRLNKLGYIPGVSTITGLGRALLGVVHTVVHLACAIFSQNKELHLQEAKLGAKIL